MTHCSAIGSRAHEVLIFRPAAPADGDAVLGMVMKPFDLTQNPALEVDRVSHRYGARIALNDVRILRVPIPILLRFAARRIGRRADRIGIAVGRSRGRICGVNQRE